MGSENRPGRAPVGWVRVLIATGLGAGYSPWVPGTFGSLPGLALAWLLRVAGGDAALAAGIAAVTALGLWAAEGGAVHFGSADPRPVVIDEIAGQMLTLLFVPLTPATAAGGFLLFRAADIVKPFPARSLERLPGGSGIMADDLMAAVYANLGLQIAVRWAPGLMGLA